MTLTCCKCLSDLKFHEKKNLNNHIIKLKGPDFHKKQFNFRDMHHKKELKENEKKKKNTDLVAQSCLALSATRAAILFKSASTIGKTSAAPTIKHNTGI